MNALDLKLQLVRRGLTQYDVSSKLGMSESQLNKILNGRKETPEGFGETFRAAVDEVARERAAQLLGEQPSDRAEAEAA